MKCRSGVNYKNVATTFMFCLYIALNFSVLFYIVHMYVSYNGNREYDKGYSDGQKNVLNKQLITNKNKDTGRFISEYDGKLYSYWYE